MSGTPLSGNRYKYSLALAQSLSGFSKGDLVSYSGVTYISLVNSNMVVPQYGAFWELYS